MYWFWLIPLGVLMAFFGMYLFVRFRRVLCTVTKRDKRCECENHATSWTTALLEEKNGCTHEVSELTRNIAGVEFLEEGNVVLYRPWDQSIELVQSRQPTTKE